MTTQQNARPVTALLGTKLGMTQVWDANGRLVPVTVVQVGFSTNFARLLAAAGGRQLIERKVRLLSIMAGNFAAPKAEYNVKTDLPAAQALFAGRPTPIVASIALGARFTLVGRAYLYGLMAGGREGVDRMIQILSDQVIRTMKLLQVTSVEELEPRHVTQLRRLVPRQ